MTVQLQRLDKFQSNNVLLQWPKSNVHGWRRREPHPGLFRALHEPKSKFEELEKLYIC